jgi:hypothetical protein
VNEKIARALAEDIKQRKSTGGTLEFHDDEAAYTVSVKVDRTLTKSLREIRGHVLKMSGAAPGSPRTCCNGTGKQ